MAQAESWLGMPVPILIAAFYPVPDKNRLIAYLPGTVSSRRPIYP
jgi:hypothetical protein